MSWKILLPLFFSPLISSGVQIDPNYGMNLPSNKLDCGGDKYENECLSMYLFRWAVGTQGDELLLKKFKCVIIIGLSKRKFPEQEITANNRYVYNISFEQTSDLYSDSLNRHFIINSNGKLVKQIYYSLLNQNNKGSNYLIWNENKYLIMKIRLKGAKSSISPSEYSQFYDIGFILTGLHYYSSEHGNITFSDVVHENTR